MCLINSAIISTNNIKNTKKTIVIKTTRKRKQSKKNKRGKTPGTKSLKDRNTGNKSLAYCTRTPNLIFRKPLPPVSETDVHFAELCWLHLHFLSDF